MLMERNSHYEELMWKIENLAGCKNALVLWNWESKMSEEIGSRLNGCWMNMDWIQMWIFRHVSEIVEIAKWKEGKCEEKMDGSRRRERKNKVMAEWYQDCIVRGIIIFCFQFVLMVCTSALCITLDLEKECLTGLNVCAVPMFILLICFSRFRFFLCVWLWIFSFYSWSSFWC